MRRAVLVLATIAGILLFSTAAYAASLNFQHGQGQGSCHVAISSVDLAYSSGDAVKFGLWNGNNPSNGVSQAYLHVQNQAACETLSGSAVQFSPGTHNYRTNALNVLYNYAELNPEMVPIIKRAGAISYCRRTGGIGGRLGRCNTDVFEDFVEFYQLPVRGPQENTFVFHSGKQCVRSANLVFNRFTDLLAESSEWVADGGRSGVFGRCNSHMYGTGEFGRYRLQVWHSESEHTYALPLQAACESYELRHENGQYTTQATPTTYGHRILVVHPDDAEHFFEVRLIEERGSLSSLEININYPYIPRSRDAQNRPWNYEIACVNPTTDPNAAQFLCESDTNQGMWDWEDEEQTQGRCCYAETLGESMTNKQGNLQFCNGNEEDGYVWESAASYFAGQCEENKYGIAKYSNAGEELTQGCFNGVLVREHPSEHAPARIEFGGAQ